MLNCPLLMPANGRQAQTESILFHLLFSHSNSFSLHIFVLQQHRHTELATPLLHWENIHAFRGFWTAQVSDRGLAHLNFKDSPERNYSRKRALLYTPFWSWVSNPTLKKIEVPFGTPSATFYRSERARIRYIGLEIWRCHTSSIANLSKALIREGYWGVFRAIPTCCARNASYE